MFCGWYRVVGPEGASFGIKEEDQPIELSHTITNGTGSIFLSDVIVLFTAL